MKGSKHLSELVNIADLRIDLLNIIKAPTGSGKTYFALTHIPSQTYDAIHNVVYLIDTINGKEQILHNYNATSEYWRWAREVDDGGMWFSPDDRVIVITYAKFGVLIDRYPDFHKNFDYIICDELHSLFKFQNFSPKPNSHSVAVNGIRAAILNDRTKVVALSATPSIIKENWPNLYWELPIDQNEILHYDQEQIIPFTNIEYTLSSVDTCDIGVCYTSRIHTMLTIEEKAKELGFSPVCIWSTANKDYQMTEEQLRVRESILKDYTIPEGYNLLIINSSAETSIKIKSPVDYVIVNNTDTDTQVQVRGRVNRDLKTIYLLNNGTEPVVLPYELLGVKLFSDGKDKVVEFVNLKNKYNRKYKWPSVKSLLIDWGYHIEEGRANNLRYAIITHLIE